MSRSPNPRRWPAVAIAVVAGLALVWIWSLSGEIRQMKMIYSYLVVVLGTLALVVWLLFFSRMGLRARLLPIVVLVVAIGAFFSVLRIRGVTGDWVPVLEWRWSEDRAWAAELETPGPADFPLPALALDLGSPAAFPGFLGPHGNSTVTGLRLARDWDAQPPRLVWKRPVGAGWAGFAIAGGAAFTLEQRGEREVTVAYDLRTGEELWSHGEPVSFGNPIAGPGPRTTPAVSRDRLFTLGATGLLSAFALRTGELLWQHDVVSEHGASLPDHGKTSSPLLVEGLVVVSAGGPDGHSLVAYDQESGELAWHAGDDASAYGSPHLATLAGRRQILIFNRASVAGHAIEDGRVLWQHPWPSDWPNVAPPVVIGEDRVLFSTGYGIGSKLLEVRRSGEESFEAELIWESPRLKAKFTNLVVHEGFVYGLDDGVMVCLDPDTGERRWKAGRYGHGNILLVGDVLLVQTERGEIVMLEPTPEAHREITRFMALEGKAWNHFAVVAPYLLVRNDQQAALYELPLQRPADPQTSGRG